MFRRHHRIFLFPDLTLMNPVLSLKERMFFVCPATLCLTDQFADQLARIPDYRKTHVKIRFFQFIFINIIQYCEALSCPVLVLEACLCKALPVSYGKKHVTVLKCEISRTCSGTSAPSHKIHMIRFQSVNTAHSCNHRNAQNIYQSVKIFYCTCKPHTISRKQYRTTALFNPVQNFFYRILCDLRRCFFWIFFRIITAQFLRLNRCSLYIQRNVQPYRSRSSVHRHIECLFQMITDFFWINDHLCIFRKRSYHRNDIAFLHSHTSKL